MAQIVAAPVAEPVNDRERPRGRSVFSRLFSAIGTARRSVGRVGATMILMGLSLLPMSVLLLALPAVSPSEAVLTDTVAPTRSIFRNLARRIGGLLTAFVLLLVLLAFSTEFVTRLNLPGGTFYGNLSRRIIPDKPTDLLPEKVAKSISQSVKDRLPSKLNERLPISLVEHWPYMLLCVYIMDLLILIAIGKVPHRYSLRNMIVRWHITALTALAFIVVLLMLTMMLAFVNGMYKLTDQSGVASNVVVMSDGATDELFSNLKPGDVSNVSQMTATEDENDSSLATPIAVMPLMRGTKSVALASRETYCVINQIVPNTDNRRRFLQLRIIVDADVSAAVHNLELVDKKHEWFSQNGTRGDLIECVVGQGVAATLGEDAKKKSLVPGDTFDLGDLKWIVVGVMKTEGTTYGSEVWCSNNSIVTKTFGKENYTTVVLRVSDDTEAGAKAMAYHIRNRYQVQKLKAVPEKEYFADLNKNNQQTLYAIIVVAIVMAIGGVFGVMNTMYAAIAQRTKDIGVLRILGFKRWQVLVSFLLESMTIALIGGAIGIAVGGLCDGFSVTSIASGGQGGGKSVAAKFLVDRDVILIGVLFTLVMGRLGGLVPALSAMRLKILESLR